MEATERQKQERKGQKRVVVTAKQQNAKKANESKAERNYNSSDKTTDEEGKQKRMQKRIVVAVKQQKTKKAKEKNARKNCGSSEAATDRLPLARHLIFSFSSSPIIFSVEPPLLAATGTWE